jgi:conjugative relaxase-like TrwC/TraI family protein
MLRVYQFKSAQQMREYYTAALAGGDYYMTDEAKCFWRGDLAKRLGLPEVVTPDDFRALCDNRVPGQDRNLTPRTDADRTAGYDLNFHVPKSVSVLHLVTQDERIIQALQASVRETMQEIEQQIQTRVRRGGADGHRPGEGLLWGEFLHSTTRPVEGRPDPHLHIHCVVFNATHDPVENRIKAGYFQDIKRDAPYHEAAFHSRLAWRMRELGFGVERNRKFWEVAGIGPELTKRFSRRTQGIEELAAQLGITDPAVKASLGARTRARKAQEHATGELRREWLGRLSSDEQKHIRGLGANRDLTRPDEESRFGRERLDRSIDHHLERSSIVGEPRLWEQALRFGFGVVRPQAIRTAAKAHEELLRRKEGTLTWVTTRGVLQEEQRLLNFARDGRGQCVPLERNQPWEPGPGGLNRQQSLAVSYLLRSRDRVMLLRGGAGTGKTTLLRSFSQALRTRGHSLVVIAPSAEASRGVLRNEGFATANTVASFLDDNSQQRAGRNGVWFVDEAGLLGVPTANRLLEKAAEQNARIVLCGDTAQHAPVERGDALRLLESRLGLQSAELSQVIRQSGSYREAVELLARGAHDQALGVLDQLGSIRQIEQQDWTPLVQEYLQLRRQGRSTLVVAPTHVAGESLTTLLRAGLQREGLLSQEERLVPQFRDTQWSVAERSDATRYEPGMVVQCVRSLGKRHPQFTRGSRMTVVGQEEGHVKVRANDGSEVNLPLDRAKDFSVQTESLLRLAAGESIRLTAGGRTLDGRHRLNTGAVYRVDGFTPEGNIRFDNGWVIPRDHGRLAHGYVSTSHAAQGRTVDWVLIAQGVNSLPAASAEQVYVSVSRGRYGVRLYTDDRSTLLQALSQSATRRTATELLGAEAGPSYSRDIAERLQRLRQYRSERPIESGRQRESTQEFGYER